MAGGSFPIRSVRHVNFWVPLYKSSIGGKKKKNEGETHQTNTGIIFLFFSFFLTVVGRCVSDLFKMDASKFLSINFGHVSASFSISVQNRSSFFSCSCCPFWKMFKSETPLQSYAHAEDGNAVRTSRAFTDNVLPMWTCFRPLGSFGACLAWSLNQRRYGREDKRMKKTN